MARDNRGGLRAQRLKLNWQLSRAHYGIASRARPAGASIAVRDQGQVAVGLTNTTQFLRSVTGGRVNVEATALSQGRTQQLWRADFTDETDRLIAHGELRLQNVAGKS